MKTLADIKKLLDSVGVNVQVLGDAKASSADRAAEAVKTLPLINTGKLLRSDVYGYINNNGGKLSNVTFSKYLNGDKAKSAPKASPFAPAEDTGVRIGNDTMQIVPEGGRVFDKAQVYFFEALLEICSHGDGKKVQLAKEMVATRIQDEIAEAARAKAQKAIESLSFFSPEKEAREQDDAFLARVKEIITSGDEYTIEQADVDRLGAMSDAGHPEAVELYKLHMGEEAQEASQDVKKK